uniref:Tryptophan/tyrosine permease n=1 Tax=Globodera pallida TaxID=36090 RepID=A0A183BIU3_GLOPA
MPLHWTSVDTRYAILCAAVPGVSAFAGTMIALKDEELVRYLKSQSFPEFAGRYKYVFLLVNTAVAAPFGLASNVLYKVGGGFGRVDTKVALALFGATVFSGLCVLPVLKNKNIKTVAANVAVLAGLSVATTTTFFNIDKISAYLTIPFTVWAILCTAMTVKATITSGKKDDDGSQSAGADSNKTTMFQE